MSRATVITDDSGAAIGVVVRVVAEEDTEYGIKGMAISALRKHGNEYGKPLNEDEGRNALASMSYCKTDSFRWIPRDCFGDGRRIPCIEEAESASRGSFIGRYWSYPV